MLVEKTNIYQITYGTISIDKKDTIYLDKK